MARITQTMRYEPATPVEESERGTRYDDVEDIVPPSLDNLKRGTSVSSCSSTARDSSMSSDGTSTDNSSLTSRTSLKDRRGPNGTTLINRPGDGRGPIVLVSADDLEPSNPDDDDDDGEEEDDGGRRAGGTFDELDEFDTDYDDQGHAATTTRALNFQWEDAKDIARLGRNIDLEGTFELPEGMTKADIMVTIDIDDEARSSDDIFFETNTNDDGGTRRSQKKEYFATGRSSRSLNNATTTNNNKTGHGGQSQLPARALSDKTLIVSPGRPSNDPSSTPTTRKPINANHHRRNFEEAVRQGILDDLRSIYTATPTTAKLVLCIVICVLSDGTLEHTFRAGGRVGLAEIALNWRLFGADNLKVYEGGITVQRKDFGIGPLELTGKEGQYYLITKLAPRAADDIMRKIGGINEDLLVDV